ncbi:MAG TPA: hypothetical protein PK109_02430 [Candidatus Paceibacterota bacterium]|nr:hypothetical protein [Candidatus Paceibacterota bacterium]
MPPEAAPILPSEEERERIRHAIEKAKVECVYQELEKGKVLPSKVNVAKFGSFPIPTINILQLMATLCADYLANDAFADKYENHDERRAWRDELTTREGFGPVVAEFFKKGNRLSSNKIQGLQSGARVVQARLTTGVLADDHAKALAREVNECLEEFHSAFDSGLIAHYNAYNPETKKAHLSPKEKHEITKKISALAERYLSLVT